MSAHDDHLDPDRHLYAGEHERDESRKRRDELLKVNTKPEPSRLEIAAMAMQGLLANPNHTPHSSDTRKVAWAAIQYADTLIAEARKEVAK